MTLNIALFAPMPRASVSTATAVNPGAWRSVRQAKRKSRRKIFEPCESALVALRLDRLCDGADAKSRGSRRVLIRGCPRRRFFVGREFEMDPQLVFKITIGTRSAERPHSRVAHSRGVIAARSAASA